MPCPLLSTLNALKYLSAKYEDASLGWSQQALQQVRRVVDEGVQVQWMEFDSFLAWQLMCDQADTQSQVQVHPHILDTAMQHLHFLRATAPDAAPHAHGESPGSTADDAKGFERLFQGKGIHRFKEAKALLQSSDVEALSFMGT